MTLQSHAAQLDWMRETLDAGDLFDAMEVAGWSVRPVVSSFDAPDGYEVSRHGIERSDETLAGAAADWSSAARRVAEAIATPKPLPFFEPDDLSWHPAMGSAPLAEVGGRL